MTRVDTRSVERVVTADEQPLTGEADALADYFSAARLARDVPERDRERYQAFHSARLGAFYALAESEDATKGD